MHHHAGRLVDDDQVLVLVQNIERNRLRLRGQVQPVRRLVLEQVTLPNPRRGPFRAAVDGHQSGAGQPAGGGAAERRVQRREHAVQPPGRACYPDDPLRWRSTYPSSRSTTPTVIAESATLKTGQKCSAMKSVTVPCRSRS